MVKLKRGHAPLNLVCRTYDLPEPIAEHRFHPRRRWRFDWAWPERKLAVEIDGAVWTQGRHTRGSGYIADMEKLNAAAELGWRVLRYATGEVDMMQIARVLADGRPWHRHGEQSAGVSQW